MLHEVLLALSGHPSPLFGDREDGRDVSADVDFPLLSPPEKALLHSLGQLSHLHRRLKRHLESISSSHASIICRATATSIEDIHLARFQQRILDVESKILKRDSSLVGAYEIVPLASVVGEFEDWHRRMAWYWDMACVMLPEQEIMRGSRTATTSCSGAQLIDRLRSEARTGFPDIEEAAIDLTRVAETAWLRQLASWLLYGKLPMFGTQDFFIQVDSKDKQVFLKDISLLPASVTSTTAASILFIGKSLHQIEHYQQVRTISATTNHVGVDRNLVAKHIQQLSVLSLPIVPTQLSGTISDIRLSLSQNILQHLLPMNETMRVLSCFRQFFLLERGEFAAALIVEAENRVQARQQSTGPALQEDPMKALQGLKIKDTDLYTSLQQVWRSLVMEDVEATDVVLEYAKSAISLTVPRSSDSRSSSSGSNNTAIPAISTISFNDLLFPTPSELNFNISPPLDLLLSPQDVAVYSSISSYLLAIRRGHQRLSELWRRSSARRDHPLALSQDAQMRKRHKQRANASRKIWATCSAAKFLLSETSAFLEGEVIKGSYDTFYEWVQKPPPNPDVPRSSPSSTTTTSQEAKAQRDPETLASGHRAFLISLTHAILLNDTPYTHNLRSLLRNIDNLIAFFTRVLDHHQRSDADARPESVHADVEAERITLELDRARKRVDGDLKMVVNRLRQLDHERVGSLRYLDVRSPELADLEVWKGGGIDRLLMKLDFGRVTDDE